MIHAAVCFLKRLGDGSIDPNKPYILYLSILDIHFIVLFFFTNPSPFGKNPLIVEVF
jgi:hypothetical protein